MVVDTVRLSWHPTVGSSNRTLSKKSTESTHWSRPPALADPRKTWIRPVAFDR